MSVFYGQVVPRLQAVEEYSTAAECAKLLCALRGQHPYEPLYVEGHYLVQWQAVIAERIIQELFAQVLR